MPLVDRLRADLDARVALVHSGLGEGERADEWRRIRAGDVDIVVGTRLAVLAPLADVGLDRRRRGARRRVQERPDAAPPGARRGDRARPSSPARRSSSAAPRRRSRASAGRARAATAGSCSRPGRRARGPSIEVVDLRAELAAGNRGLLSRPAGRRRSRRSTARRRAGDPRRSTGGGPRRSSCAATAATSRRAPSASGRSSTTRPGRRSAAITAAGRRRSRRRCPNCGSPRIRYLGGGTQRRRARGPASGFPALRVGRLDRDVVERRGAAERVIDAFAGGRLDVLVGTSLVTKGLDIPAVTLVGVVSRRRRPEPARRAGRRADLPAPRPGRRVGPAAATGRAARSSRPTSPTTRRSGPSPSDDAAAFYDAELELRRRFGSPPFGRLVKLTVGLADRDGAERDAAAMADRLREPAARARRATIGRPRAGPGLHRQAGRPLAVERRPPRRRPGRPPRRRPGRAVVGRRGPRNAPLNVPCDFGDAGAIRRRSGRQWRHDSGGQHHGREPRSDRPDRTTRRPMMQPAGARRLVRLDATPQAQTMAGTGQPTERWLGQLQSMIDNVADPGGAGRPRGRREGRRARRGRRATGPARSPSRAAERDRGCQRQARRAVARRGRRTCAARPRLATAPSRRASCDRRRRSAAARRRRPRRRTRPRRQPPRLAATADRRGRRRAGRTAPGRPSPLAILCRHERPPDRPPR